jgi:hypothetical protein
MRKSPECDTVHGAPLRHLFTVDIDPAEPYGLPLLKAIFWQAGQTDN